MDATAESQAPLPPGQVLAAERERQGLSRTEVAQRLHMSAWQVEALESGDFERLPKGTFLRGFVRNYAKVLGVSCDPLLSSLANASPRQPAPGIVVPSQNIRFDPLGERLSNPYVKAAALAVVVTALGFAAMYWWLFIRPTPLAGAARKPAVEAQQIAAAPVPPAEAPPPTAAPIVAEPPQVEAAPPAAPKVEPPKAEPAKPAPAKAAPAKAEPARAEAAKPEAPKPLARGEHLLRFRFKGESWVEVRDAQDRVLLSRLNLPGSEALVSGRTPLTVVVGNAPDVQMTYDDRDFPLEPHTKVAVARFILE